MKAQMSITPQALETLKNQSNFPLAAQEVLNDLKKESEKPPIITEKIVNQILSSGDSVISKSTTQETKKTQKVSEEKAEHKEVSEDTEVSQGETTQIEEPKPQVEQERRPEEKEWPEVQIHKDITGQSTSEGDIEDFVQLFRDRYDRLSKILKQRKGLRDAIRISGISNYEGRQVKIIGIVMSKRETRKGDAKLIQIEDPTGRATIYVKDSQRNAKLIEKIKEVVTDEVICAEVQVPDNLSGDKRGPLVWGNNVTWPDIPARKDSEEQDVPDESICATLISDIHVGSKMFQEDTFNEFVRWLKGEAGNEKQRELASKVKYLIIAGDLVDGIGIYPRQQEELEISDVYKQYEAVAEYLSQVPDRIKIIAAPGNHDAVRLAEPQPALPSEVASPLEEIGVKLVSNPAYVSIHGVKFLIYHGGGFDDLIASISELDREHSLKPMRYLLKKRHLAPIYGEPMGGRTPIAPEERDYLVVDEVPDIIHSGHLHVYSSGRYRDVVLINSATFQSRTSYMKRMGVKPTPGVVPTVNLKTKEVRPIQFE